MPLRPLTFGLAVALAGCMDETRTNDADWAINGEKTGVFASLSSIVSCSLQPGSPTGPAEPHVNFGVFLKHAELDSIDFELVPLPDVMWGQRALLVGKLGLSSHREDVAHFQPVVGRAELSVGKLVPHPQPRTNAREVFVHHLVLPDQPQTAPDGRAFTLNGRLSDVRLYCTDLR
jgi:hypothetical protein